MTFIFYVFRISSLLFIKQLELYGTSPLPAPGRGVPSLRGGVREHDGVPKSVQPKRKISRQKQ